MEIVGWIAAAVIAFTGVAMLLQRGFNDLFGLTKPKAEVDEWADWKRYAAEHRRIREQANKEWIAAYKELIQKNCSKHLYHHQRWYTCINCGYEEPWEYKEGCGCSTATSTALTDDKPRYVLIGERVHWCKVHGTDSSMFPISDRTRGDYGPRGGSDDGAVERSQELTKKYPVRKINYEFENNK